MKSSQALTSRLSARVSFIEFQQSLPSRTDVIDPFIAQITRFIARFRGAGNRDTDIELALREALANAIVHGNREDPGQRVAVICRCGTNGEVSITVQDEGEGFDYDSVPDPTAPETRLRATGRGIYLMKALMDDVRFEQRGAVVHMRKKANADSAGERRAG